MMDAEAWSTRGAHYASSEVHKHGPSLFKLLELARPRAADSCLDIGTGTGHTAAALAERAGHVIGLDVSKGMLRAARELYAQVPNLEFVLAPAQDTGLKTGTFDLITARHTLHHHPDPGATLGEAARLLKPGGRMVIVDEVTPDAELDAWYDALERTRDHTHVRAYLLHEWRALIAGSGLRWIVGDCDTRYTIDIASWLGRMELDPSTTAAAYDLLASADGHARDVLQIAYQAGRAVRFEMPMALILAVKPL